MKPETFFAKNVLSISLTSVCYNSVPPVSFTEGRPLLLLCNNDHFHSLIWWINLTLFECNARAKQLRAFTSTFTFSVLFKTVVYFVFSTEPPLRIRWITAERNLIKLCCCSLKQVLLKKEPFTKTISGAQKYEISPQAKFVWQNKK